MTDLRNRKRHQHRAQHDFYPTPRWAVEASLDLVPRHVMPELILDPGAGAGPWGQGARSRWPVSIIAGVELRSDAVNPGAYDLWWTGIDYLAMPEHGPCVDLIIGNPPYRCAEQFVRRSLALLRPDGHLLFLLRLGFLEGQERGSGLWHEYPPLTVGVYSQRPSFTGDSQTDATAYAAFLWQRGVHKEPSLRWLRPVGATQRLRSAA